MNKPHIAFLGLGIMGSGMARRLLASGFPLSAYNRNSEKARLLESEGAKFAGSPFDAAEHADIVISMVADDKASRAVWFGENGAVKAVKHGTICIECSTVTVDWVKELSVAVAAKQGEFLDAPVTGSKIQAVAGELNFLVGGDPVIVEKARPVLSAMGKAIVHLGPIGSGAMTKLINNFVCGVQVASLAEAISMIERAGLDRVRALEVLKDGAPGSPLFKTVAARMTAPDFTPNFLLKLMAKDLGYAIEQGGKLSVELRTAFSALDVFRQAMEEGEGDKDMSAVVKQFRKKPEAGMN